MRTIPVGTLSSTNEHGDARAPRDAQTRDAAHDWQHRLAELFPGRRIVGVSLIGNRREHTSRLRFIRSR